MIKISDSDFAKTKRLLDTLHRYDERKPLQRDEARRKAYLLLKKWHRHPPEKTTTNQQQP